MTSNDANGIATAVPSTRGHCGGASPLALRCDDAACADHDAAGAIVNGNPVRAERPVKWARIERAWWVALVGTMLVFSAFPIVNQLLGLSTKDYGLWYHVGLAVRQGLDVYPRPETGRLFPFMYPPSAAAMLAWISTLGHTGLLLALVLVNSAAWLVCIALSNRLAVDPGMYRHPLVLIIPSFAVIVLIHNIYLLGQPNLLLLALLLGAFVCLQSGRNVAAGALVATAAAIKAFPILALGYLLYRRMWTASATTIAVLSAWLLIAPLPFRTPAQALDDVGIWSQGMLFTYNSYGIAQRPIRSYSYKNQSIMALAHRLFRDVPADGEAVLSERAMAGQVVARPSHRLPRVDATTDLFFFLKPHGPHLTASAERANKDEAKKTASSSARNAAETAQRALRWNDAFGRAEPALRAAWKVNFVDLNFGAVTAITLVSILVICVFAAAVMPPANRRTRQTDALEFALVTLMTVMFSPLSFNYAYVWLIYPITLALHIVISEPENAPHHRLKIGWITAVVLIPALAVPMPLSAQAYGNLFLPALLLVFGLGAMLHSAGRQNIISPRY